jgi:GGDEF domain-containing protein
MNGYGWFFAVFFIDFNHIKTIGGTRGRDKGVRVLQKIAGTIEKGIR